MRVSFDLATPYRPPTFVAAKRFKYHRWLSTDRSWASLGHRTSAAYDKGHTSHWRSTSDMGLGRVGRGRTLSEICATSASPPTATNERTSHEVRVVPLFVWA